MHLAHKEQQSTNLQFINYFQAMRAVTLDVAAVPLTVFSGLDRGRPCGSGSCQWKQGLLEGIRVSGWCDGTSQETKASLSLWMTDRRENGGQGTHTAVELKHETSNVRISWSLLVQSDCCVKVEPNFRIIFHTFSYRTLKGLLGLDQPCV